MPSFVFARRIGGETACACWIVMSTSVVVVPDVEPVTIHLCYFRSEWRILDSERNAKRLVYVESYGMH